MAHEISRLEENLGNALMASYFSGPPVFGGGPVKVTLASEALADGQIIFCSGGKYFNGRTGEPIALGYRGALHEINAEAVR